MLLTAGLCPDPPLTKGIDTPWHSPLPTPPPAESSGMNTGSNVSTISARKKWPDDAENHQHHYRRQLQQQDRWERDKQTDRQTAACRGIYLYNTRASRGQGRPRPDGHTPSYTPHRSLPSISLCAVYQALKRLCLHKDADRWPPCVLLLLITE